MKFLIAHQSTSDQMRIQQVVARMDYAVQFLLANELTETYHLAEHHEPDCVLIAEQLTHHREFELIASLFKILGIQCIILKGSPSSPSQHPVFPQLRQVSELDLEDTIYNLGSAIKSQIVSSQLASGSQSSVTQFDPKRIVLIGASTGGIDALLTVTKAFDSHCPPILIVQHTGGQFAKSLIRLLDGACRAKVQAATHGLGLAAGNIYLAPDDQTHLVLSTDPKPTLRLDGSSAVSGHRPSIDALFSSAVSMAPHVSAALLTGMGKDGAEGLTKLRTKGAYTIGQDKQTSVVYGMPRVAMEMGGVCEQLRLEAIGPALLRSCKMKART